jgi:hypothetical protein
MGLLDGLLGNSGGGLLDFLRQNAMNQQMLPGGLPSDQAQYAPMQHQMQAMARMPQAQPSPLDTAQWPSGPVGAPSQASAALPPNAQPTQGQMPMQAPMPQGEGSFTAGMRALGNPGGFINKIADAVQGFSGAPTQANQTAQFLVSKGLDPALAKTIVSDPGLLRSVLPSLLGTGGQTDDIKEYQFAKREDPSLTFEKFMSRKKSVTGEYGLTPIWGTDKDGKPTYVQPGKSGDARLANLPEGFQIARDPIKVDAGTHFVLLDPQTRQPVGTVPKNIAEKEAQEKEGAAKGSARVALPAAENTTNRALKMLKQAEEHPGLSDSVGFIMGRFPALTPKGADFRERIEQIDAMVFGDAVEVMRGLGALTDKEGPKVTAARARLKTAKSEEDFRTALKDVREVFETGIENMRQKAGGGSAPAAAPKRIRLNADGNIIQ